MGLEKRWLLMWCAGACTVVVAAQPAAAAMNYMEDWSAGDTNGWMQSTTSTTVLRDDTFGNPAGSLVARRVLAQPLFDIGFTSGLAAISGDYTGAPQWETKFDVFYDSGNFVDTWLRFRFQDASFDGWHLSVEDTFPQAWQSYLVVIDPTWTDAEAAANGWVDETAGAISWQQLMSDVFQPEVRLVLGDDQSAIGHLDNFMLRRIPAPSTLALFGLAGLATARRRR